MRLSVIENIDQIPAADWDRLTGGNNPFLRHAFLSALERTGCVAPQTGWWPQHLIVYADGNGDGLPIGAAPMYLKGHSYGEYVFDWAWAHAYERANLSYYPKLVATVPFTPATGPRLLVPPGDDEWAIKQQLAEGALALASETRASSLHWLFTTSADIPLLEAAGHMCRTGCQFHWHNPGYDSFAQFLAELSSTKRKKLKQERRYVRDAGVCVRVATGDTLGVDDWDTFYQFYRSTIRGHGAIPYLSREFFHSLGAGMQESIVMVLARQDKTCIAAALNLRGRDTLYGRYWGSHRYINGLHFEVCYYSAMEFCINQGLQRFEAGAQGEHKLARGFLPVTTYSAHWLSHAGFNQAVSDFLANEKLGVNHYIDELNEHSPFKQRQ
ncbi:MAG: GNAT family N-acetyltransferase [Acidiferrobacterales bacterium]